MKHKKEIKITLDSNHLDKLNAVASQFFRFKDTIPQNKDNEDEYVGISVIEGEVK